ncbi:MAG: hypothetical protein EHM13_12450 [Acidobacteria bacterium]|nr:MAG: hypothetical protein EHM13_12450 [Acidobacteriota bacterium]
MPQVPYVYNGTLYDLTLNDSRYQANARYHDLPYGNVVETDFRVDNRTTREKTEFTICYSPASGAPHVVPVRIVYRPKWWLELEMLRPTRQP